jgi:alpha 1,2-mannosyltransferase
LYIVSRTSTQHDDVLIFHEGDLTSEDEHDLASGRPEVRCVRVPERFWYLPHVVAHDDRSKWRLPHFGVGYRHMMRWYTLAIWPCLEEMGYEYAMRMQPSACRCTVPPFAPP